MYSIKEPFAGRLSQRDKRHSRPDSPRVGPGCAGRGTSARKLACLRLLAAGLVSLVSAGLAFGQTTIEVDVNGTFTPLDKAVVPTANPTIRITRDVDVPSDFTVLLTRADGRAGIGGAGKTITVGPVGSNAALGETGEGTNVFVGIIQVLIGVNTIHIRATSGGPDLLTATMLLYTFEYEDLNGNGLLDRPEDINRNGLLDPGEDLNGNLFLDNSEDLNGNGQLDKRRALRTREAGAAAEDSERDDVMEPFSVGVGTAYPQGPADFGTIAVTNLRYSRRAILLDFVESATDAQISAFLQERQLAPTGVIVDNTLPSKPKVVIVDIPPGVDALRRVKELNGLDVAGHKFFPNLARLPVSPPLRAAALITSAPRPTVVGETIPNRLMNGAAAPPSAGNAGEGYSPNNGGFDNNGDLCNIDNDGDGTTDEDPFGDSNGDGMPGVSGVDDDGDGLIDEDSLGRQPGDPGWTNDLMNDDDEDGETDEDPTDNAPCDELDIFWHHFMVQTFAAHRLVDLLAAGGANRPLVAQVDSGIGGEVGGVYVPAVDIPPGRILKPTNCSVSPCTEGAVNDIPDRYGHGNQVAHLLVGQGARVLGTGKDVNLRPIFDSEFSDPVAGGRAVALAALDPDVHVILIESQAVNLDIDIIPDGMITDHAVNGVNELENAVDTLNDDEVGWRQGITAVHGSDKIVVIPAGNWNHDTDFTLLGGARPAVGGIAAMERLFDAPVRGTRAAGNDNSLVVGVSNSTLTDVPTGTEARSTDSNFGTRISVAGTGNGVPAPHPLTANQPYGPFGGTSGAAPIVAGLCAELLYLDANSAAVGPLTNFRIVQLVEATADDLGSTTAYPGPFVNNDAGDGEDNQWGYGRTNAWKAVLSAINGGISEQHGRTAGAGGNDSVFESLPLIDDSETKWYGFEIITSERQATVWIDGTQLQDAGASMPLAPNITAYKGVRSDLRIERGVHNLTDGSATDPNVPDGDPVTPGNQPRPGWTVEEDPTSGIVPVGTLHAGKGQYVMTFSITRDELYDEYGDPRTLSLRRRGQGVNDRPIFNLRLETEKMRRGEISGVSFDDFVFQITPPDYGDAAIPPTLLSESGARHENSNLEWLGKLEPADQGQVIPNLKSVTPEHNADLDLFDPWLGWVGGDATVDVDGVTNRLGNIYYSEFHDRDGRDDGALFFPLTYKPGQQGKMEFTVGVFDHESERYSADVDKSLYVNLWVDWDTDGEWEDLPTKEHVIDGLRLNPQRPNWIEAQDGNPSTDTQHLQNSTDGNRAKFRSTFLVPDIGCEQMWARMRIDYGENVGRNDPRPHFRSLPSLRRLNLDEADPQPLGEFTGFVYGAARYGEVEDYLIGTDFGDAPDAGFPVYPEPWWWWGWWYPTLKDSDGARHLDIHQEWLGPDNNDEPNPSREIDPDDLSCLGAGTDQDYRPNLDPADTDYNCDGVQFVPIFPSDYANVIGVEVTVTSSISARGAVAYVRSSGKGANRSVAGPLSVGFPDDKADTLPRYDAGDGKRRLYLAAWADWNGDGVWSTPDEKIIDDIIDPDTFGLDQKYTLGEYFEDENKNGVYDQGEPYTDQFGVDTATFVYPFEFPWDFAGNYYLRFRLAYGEDESTADLAVKENDEDGRSNSQDRGGALFGEVEDYLIEIDYFPLTTAAIDVVTPYGPESIDLIGPTTIIVNLGELSDGGPTEPEWVPTEITHMELVGYSNRLSSPVMVRLRPETRSTGVIEEKSNDTPDVLDVPPFTSTGAALSYFDVYFEVVTDAGVYHNEVPAHMEAQITHKPPGKDEEYRNPYTIKLYNESGEYTGIDVVEEIHIPNPQKGACCDKTVGICWDDVLEIDCQGDQQQWFKETPCTVIPCPRHWGACCDHADGTCTDEVLPEDCVGQKRVWYKYQTCEEIDCQRKTPAVTAWGMIVIALLLLTGIGIKFGRRRRSAGAA